MRREWAGLIKNRQWDEFEAMAKKDPNQLLCDTVAELERGFTEKPDRRALKKILYLLEQAGYSPQEIEEHQEPQPERQRFEAGFMMSSDARGDTPITYGFEEKGRVRWLTAYVNEGTGITNASEEDMTPDEAEARLRQLRTASAKPYVSSEIPAEYALSRLARALKRHAGPTPMAIAYWRTILSQAAEMPHPSDQLKATETTETERKQSTVLLDSTLMWRLELGLAMPLMQELYEAEQRGEGADEDARRERTQAIFADARKQLFTETVIADHLMRLRDLAYLIHLHGGPETGLLLSAAQDLEGRGPDSDYARGLLDKTVVLLVQTMRQSAEKEKAAQT
jgi:hypothetical protein